MTKFSNELAKLPPDARPVVEKTQALVRSMIHVCKTTDPAANNALVGFELFVQGFAMMTKQSEEAARDALCTSFRQAFSIAKAQMGHRPGKA